MLLKRYYDIIALWHRIVECILGHQTHHELKLLCLQIILLSSTLMSLEWDILAGACREEWHKTSDFKAMKELLDEPLEETLGKILFYCGWSAILFIIVVFNYYEKISPYDLWNCFILVLSEHSLD